MDSAQAELNFTAYLERHKRELEKQHWGRIVLMHDGEIAGIYNDRSDAYSVGAEKYGLGNFSLQKIGERPARLGIITAAIQ